MAADGPIPIEDALRVGRVFAYGLFALAGILTRICDVGLALKRAAWGGADESMTDNSLSQEQAQVPWTAVEGWVLVVGGPVGSGCEPGGRSAGVFSCRARGEAWSRFMCSGAQGQRRMGRYL